MTPTQAVGLLIEALKTRLPRKRLRARRWSTPEMAALQARERFAPLPPSDQAELATALLQRGLVQEAQLRFAKLLKECSADTSNNKRYIRHYSRYYLALIRDDRSQAAYEQSAARAFAIKGLSTTLPMPELPERHKAYTTIVSMS